MGMRRPLRSGSTSAASAGLALVLALSGVVVPASAGVPLCAGQPATHVGTAGDDALTTITIAYGWTGSGCTSESETTIGFKTPLEIVDNAFDIDNSGGTLSLQVHGGFTSDTAATGTFSVTDSGDFCPGSASGTWEAAKA